MADNVRVYGAIGGTPQPEDKTRCVVELVYRGVLKQCSQPRGHGHEGLYCKRHMDNEGFITLRETTFRKAPTP